MTTLLSDRYAVGELLGAGGAARVHSATDRVLGRRVAVKVLDDDVARSADPAGRARFLAEVRTAARIAHPNLVTVYDAGEDGGELFLVMEFVEGVTLAELIARRAPLPIDEATSIASQMLDGLAAVHGHGTIHRDVKPANVLVGDDGRVRLADFGIAKRLDEIEASVTAAGTLVGSPSYLAPEQATGGRLSPATDVYQAGLVLHEMLTGHRHGGASPQEAARATPADPRLLRPEVPDVLADVVRRSTDPDPAARYPAAEAMRDALTADRRTLAMPIVPHTEVLTPAAARARPSHRRVLTILLAGLVALLVVGLIAMAATGTDDGTELLPGPTTVPTVPPTVELTVPVATTAPPPTVAPATDAPAEPGHRDRGRAKGNGKNKEH